MSLCLNRPRDKTFPYAHNQHDNALLNCIRDQIHCLEEDLNKKKIKKNHNIIADQQEIGNMGPACCDQITGAPSVSLVDHIRLHMQEASLSRNLLVY